MTEEVVNYLDTMLRKLAMKRIVNGHLKAEFEDVVSELWINALKIIEDRGEVDFNYIAKASMYKMVDIVRYNVNHESTAIPEDELDRIVPEQVRNAEPSSLGASRSKSYTYTSVKPQLADERVEVMAILDLFEKDSRERTYVETLMKIEGIIEVENPEELPDRAIDSFIADLLGYAGCKSNGYGRLKKRVREILTINGYVL